MENRVFSKAGGVALYVCLFILLSVFGLWAWNTIAELFTWPQAQYKHLIAAMCLLLVVRVVVFQHVGRHQARIPDVVSAG
jgi:uncharacterized membrane protein YqjE